MTNTTRKAQRRETLRNRMRAALDDIYGNARTPWADDVDGFRSYYDWLGDYAQREAEYMTGERFGYTEQETRAPRWYGAARRLQDARRKYPNDKRRRILDARNFYAARPRDISALLRDGVPECYGYGRNGKTFYPVTYASENGCGFRVRDDSDEMSAEQLTDAVQWLEQFNAHVRATAAAAPECYREESREHLKDRAHDLRAAIRAEREAFATLAAELRALRNIKAPSACAILRDRLRNIAASVREAAAELRAIGDTLAEF